MRSSMRLLSLGATAAFIFAACSKRRRRSHISAQHGAIGERRAERKRVRFASAGGGSVDWTACVAFDTGGLGDKGFNDLGKKGLEDAAALGYTTFFSEAQGATDYAANIQRLIDRGCQSIVTVGFNQARPRSKRPRRTRTSPSRRSTRSGTRRPTARPRRTSPAWTSRSTRPRCSPATRRGLQQDRQDRHLRRPAVPRRDPVHGRPPAGIKSTTRRRARTSSLGWDPATQQGTFVGGDNPWGDPAKGEQLAKTLLDQGVDIVHPVAGATGNGTIKAMLAEPAGDRRRHRPGDLARRVRQGHPDVG